MQKSRSRILKPIQKRFQQSIWNIFKELTTTEIIQIIDNLRRENLKKGKKFTPFCKIQITRELKEFDKKIIKILDQIIGKESKNLRTHNLYVKLR